MTLAIARRTGALDRGNSLRSDRHLERDIIVLLDLLERYGAGISRENLADFMRVPDRRMRLAVEQARLRGHPVICTAGSPRLYRLAQSHGEIELWLEHECRSRLLTLAEQARAITKRARALFGEHAYQLVLLAEIVET